MTERNTPSFNGDDSGVFQHPREAPRPQFNEERARYILLSQHQSNQASYRSFEATPTAAKAGVKLTQATQGLKELQEKINVALKRSSSATSIRPQQKIYANSLVSALNQTQNQAMRTYQTEITNETMESFYESRSRAPASNLYVSTIKVVPNNISVLPVERVVHVNSQTPQASSTNFYLGGLNPNARTKEEMLQSIKNYQVKTIKTVDSSRKHYTSHNTTQHSSDKSYVQYQHQQQYQQQQPQRQRQQPTGSSIKLKNFTTQTQIQTDFQPGYDREKLDSMISKIMNSNQSYTPIRQDSFVSPQRTLNVTNYESHANSRVFESRVPRDNSREISQQYYHPRPLQPVVNKAPVQIAYQRPVNEKKAPSRTEQSLKKSHVGEMEADGDSMICDFIKENDQLLDFEEEIRPKKKARDADSENLFVRKVPKRQEIIHSKKQERREPTYEQLQRKRKEMTHKSQTSEMPSRNRRRI